MRVGVLSDTHNRLDLASMAIKQMGSIEVLLHAGDLYHDAFRLTLPLEVQVVAVRGNSDYGEDGRVEEVLELAGHKILLTHGHLYRVKHACQKLLDRAKKLQVKAVVFGHTHIVKNVVEDDILLFNPGSISFPMGGTGPSYGLLEIDNKGITGEIFYL